jgi:hypothetical protein
MKTKILAPVLAATLSGAALMGAAGPAAAAPPPTAPQAGATAPVSTTSVPISGTGTTADGVLATFTGSFDLTKFAVQNGQLVAVGNLTGTLTDALGNSLGSVTNVPITLPVGGSSTTGTCDILHLDLGPLDLDLLGLQVHLDEVVLDITAQSGAGNLLGNLLCSVAGLLDSGLSLGSVATLLNQLLGL